jgi:hypothetical protein
VLRDKLIALSCRARLGAQQTKRAPPVTAKIITKRGVVVDGDEVEIEDKLQRPLENHYKLNIT